MDFQGKVALITGASAGIGRAAAIKFAMCGAKVVIVDINEERAKGEAMDIRQATPLMSKPVDIYAGSYAAAEGSDIVIITSGVGRKPGQTRIDLVNTNVETSAVCNVPASVNPSAIACSWQIRNIQRCSPYTRESVKLKLIRTSQASPLKPKLAPISFSHSKRINVSRMRGNIS